MGYDAAKAAEGDNPLPAEVKKQLLWAFDNGELPTRVHFAEKKLFSKGEAWDQILPEGEEGRGRRLSPRLWRKLHTENYWVWCVPKQEKKDHA